MLLAGLFCLLGVAGMAQTEAPRREPVKIDLDKALEIALSESPTIQVADQEIKRKEYAKKEQIAGLFPNLSASGSYTRTLEKQAFAFEGQVTKVGTENNWMGGFNLGLPLIAPTLWKTIQLSELDVQYTIESARSSRLSLVNEVRKAYYTLLLSQDSYAVLLASYQNSEFNAKVTTDKYNQGLVSEYDKLRADVRVKNQRPGLISAENAVKLSTMQLKVLMGVDVNENILFTGALNDFESVMYTGYQNLLADTTNLSLNTDLRQLDLQKKQLEKSAAINRQGYWPTLNFSANYQWMALTNDFDIASYRWNPYSTLGVSLNIPIFDGLARARRNQQNKISISNIQLQRVELERNLRVSVKNSVNNMEGAVEEMASNKESVMMAERAYSISARSYEIGKATLLELNDAEIALTQARLAYSQAIYNYLAARADLEKTIGINNNIR